MDARPLLPGPRGQSPHKSFTGKHYLVSERQYEFVHPVSASQEGGLWTFGRGTVIWRIWPAVLLHTLFALVVVYLSEETPYDLRIPQSLLVVIGVVIGFVIAYRVSSGYDRYTQGRAMWSEVIKNIRTLSRLVWISIPARISKDGEPTREEIQLALSEKKAALAILEGYAIALKHHLRGEYGIYYVDLYYLLLPLHRGTDTATATVTSLDTNLVTSPSAGQTTFPQGINRRHPQNADPQEPGPSSSPNYGAIDPGELEHTLRPAAAQGRDSLTQAVSTKYIPFWTFIFWAYSMATFRSFRKMNEVEDDLMKRRWRKKVKIAGEGHNLPLDIVRAISEWFCALDARGTGGPAWGSMMGCLQNLESSLTDLERLLTTPLPIIYSAHLRHTVWLYLFFLPFQLIDQLHYLTILAVGIAAFLYLGFLAAGEEIEQPFGYEENDLDLDLLIREIIHVNIDSLLATSSFNSYSALKPKEERTEGAIADACKTSRATSKAFSNGTGPHQPPVPPVHSATTA